jgi:hypothetical protein
MRGTLPSASPVRRDRRRNSEAVIPCRGLLEGKPALGHDHHVGSPGAVQ